MENRQLHNAGRNVVGSRRKCGLGRGSMMEARSCKDAPISSSGAISDAARLAAALITVWVCGTTQLPAQSGGCSLVPDDRNPSERILRCGSGLSIHSASGTQYRLVGPQGRPTGARLDSGALLIEFSPGEGRRNFQILTPQAIAAVRGTRWAVEVQSNQTSTLVLTGAVSVTRRTGSERAILHAGEGADVTAERGPVVVKRWAAARVRALLARFGE
jgi:ferric-dicitrate binding protein FerR (iron transport regulator)